MWAGDDPSRVPRDPVVRSDGVGRGAGGGRPDVKLGQHLPRARRAAVRDGQPPVVRRGGGGRTGIHAAVPSISRGPCAGCCGDDRDALFHGRHRRRDLRIRGRAGAGAGRPSHDHCWGIGRVALFAVACGPMLWVQMAAGHSGPASAWLLDHEGPGHAMRSLARLARVPLQLVGKPYSQPIVLDVLFVSAVVVFAARGATRKRVAALPVLAFISGCAAPLAFDLGAVSKVWFAPRLWRRSVTRIATRRSDAETDRRA